MSLFGTTVYQTGFHKVKFEPIFKTMISVSNL